MRRVPEEGDEAEGMNASEAVPARASPKME